MVAPRNKSKSTTAPGQRTNQPTSPAARPKYQQSPREVRRRVFPSDIDPSPSCPTPSMPSNRPQPAAGHVTPWTSCYAPPPPTRVIVPASAEHQAAHNATRSRDPRATIGHNKNARRIQIYSRKLRYDSPNWPWPGWSPWSMAQPYSLSFSSVT